MGRKSSELSDEQRKIVIDLHNDGKSLREIAKIMKRSASTIQYVVSKYKKSGQFKKSRRNVNRCKLTRRHCSFLRRQIRIDPSVSGVTLAASLAQNFGIHVTPQTVRNYVKKIGYKSRYAVRKPFVSLINKQKRIAFAKKYQNKDSNFWKRVIFTDESKFNIKSSDGRVKIWREKNTSLSRHNLIPTFKHGGGSVMVWGCFSASGVGNLHFVDGIMTARDYINILKQNLKQSAAKLGISSDFIFQQDNDPKHTALDSRLWILYNCPKYLKTPPQSPDLNPIENLWSIFKKKMKHYDIRNVNDLKVSLRTEWNKISPQLTSKLVESMPRRLSAVIKQKGYPTKY